jgi:type I restriction enzyme, S subunit
MNAPKLRFKEFDAQWQQRFFEDLYEFKNGLNKEKEAFGSGTPILNYMDVNKNTFIDIYDIKGKVNLTDSEIERFLVKNNDLFFTRTSETSEEIGLTCSYIGENTNLVFSGFVLKASPKLQEIDSTFYSYYLRTFNKRKEIIKHSSITTRALTSGTLLSSMPINYTSIAEQKKIASFLKKIDYKIQLQQEKIDLLKVQKKGYMQKIFNQELRFKDDYGQNYPEWSITYIKDCFDNYGGTALEKHVIPDGAYKFISIGSYNENGNYNDQKLRVNLNDKTKGKLLSKDNLVMVLNDKTLAGNIIGRVLLIENDNEYIYNQRSERLVCKKCILPKYAWYYLNSDYFRKKIISMAQGGTQIYVNFSNVSRIEFQLPTLNEQNKILSFLNKLELNINHEEKKLKLIQSKKQAFMQQMFT